MIIGKLKLEGKYRSLKDNVQVIIDDMVYSQTENKAIVLFKTIGNKTNHNGWAYEDDFKENYEPMKME